MVITTIIYIYSAACRQDLGGRHSIDPPSTTTTTTIMLMYLQMTLFYFNLWSQYIINDF